MGILAIVGCQTPFTVQLGFENPTLAGKGLLHQCRKHRTEPVRLCAVAHTFSYLWREASHRIRETQMHLSLFPAGHHAASSSTIDLSECIRLIASAKSDAASRTTSFSRTRLELSRNGGTVLVITTFSNAGFERVSLARLLKRP